MHARFITIVGHLALGIVCMSVASAQERHAGKLEGSWILDSIEMRGQKRQVEDLPARFQGMKQTIKGEKMIAANWK